MSTDQPNVVFATTNPAKLADVQKIVAHLPLEIKSLADVGVKPINVEETGTIFEENSLLKYKALRPLVPSRFILVTEDSGIEIDALNGEPGVYSRRWNDQRREMTDQEIIQKTNNALAGQENRVARFVSAMTYGGASLPVTTIRGELIGELLKTPVKLPKNLTEGFPYRAFFYIPGLKRMMYELHDIPLSKRPDYPSHREQTWLQFAAAVLI